MNEKKQLAKDPYINISQVFLQEKKLIIVLTIVFTLLCAVFIYKYKPVYEAQAVLAPISEIHPSFIHLQPVFYLQTGGDGDFSLGDLYSIFNLFMSNKEVLRSCFNQIFPNNTFINFEKRFTLQVDYSKKTYKFIIRSTAEDALHATNHLAQLIELVNLKANHRVKILLATDKKNIFRNASLPRFFPLRWGLYPLNYYPKRSRAYQLLVAIYKANYDLSMPTKNSSSSIKLYSELPILLNTKELNPRLRITLIIGVWGGLILGFLAGAFHMGMQRRIIAPKLEYQLL